MKTKFLIAVLVSLFPGVPALADGHLIYDVHERHSLKAFELFLERPQDIQKRPRLTLLPDGLGALPGEGHFNAWKFADVAGRDFVLDVVFEVPKARNSNSGIFILFADPTANLEGMSDEVRAQYLRSLQQARERRRSLGGAPGPFELDYFAYEVQICRGPDFAAEPRNKRTGAFYGVPVGEGDGQQRILAPYDLNVGDTYQLRITFGNGLLKSYLRSVAHQDQLVPIAELKLRSDEVDAIRGGAPSALLLQAYWNNGSTAKLFKFKNIAVTYR
jgi:hypothetical protein